MRRKFVKNLAQELLGVRVSVRPSISFHQNNRSEKILISDSFPSTRTDRIGQGNLGKFFAGTPSLCVCVCVCDYVQFASSCTFVKMSIEVYNLHEYISICTDMY